MERTICRVAATLFVAASISGGSAAVAQTPPSVLVIGQIAEPKSLDPAAVTAVNDFRILMNLYDGLVRYKDGTLEVEPALARSWKISADGLAYTFALRDGVKFHDGSAFTADAVKFDFDRMLDEKSPYHDTGPFPLSFFFSAVKEVKALDPLTVEFDLKEPYAPFLSNLAYPTGLIISPEAIKKYGKEIGRHPSGTGAFAFKEWESNSKVVLERNPAYWGGAPKLEAVVFRPIKDGARYQIFQQAGPHVWFLILNAKEPPFNDKRMRQAVNYAVNKKAIADNLLRGTAQVAAGPTPPAFAWAYNDALTPYPYDPEKAKGLIKEAGYDGKPLILYVTEGGSGMLDPVPMGTAIQADLAAVGLKVNIETYEWNTFLGKVNPGLEGKANLAEMAWMTNDPDTLPYLALRTGAWPDKGGFNSGYYSNPEVDKLLEGARQSTDQAERAKLYKKMQEIVHDDAPWLFVANWRQNAVSSIAVKNFKLQPSFFLLLHDVTKG